MAARCETLVFVDQSWRLHSYLLEPFSSTAACALAGPGAVTSERSGAILNYPKLLHSRAMLFFLVAMPFGFRGAAVGKPAALSSFYLPRLEGLGSLGSVSMQRQLLSSKN